jgi:hypothetical protein
MIADASLCRAAGNCASPRNVLSHAMRMRKSAVSQPSTKVTCEAISCYSFGSKVSATIRTMRFIPVRSVKPQEVT